MKIHDKKYRMVTSVVNSPERHMYFAVPVHLMSSHEYPSRRFNLQQAALVLSGSDAAQCS